MWKTVRIIPSKPENPLNIKLEVICSGTNNTCRKISVDRNISFTSWKRTFGRYPYDTTYSHTRCHFRSAPHVQWNQMPTTRSEKLSPNKYGLELILSAISEGWQVKMFGVKILRGRSYETWLRCNIHITEDAAYLLRIPRKRICADISGIGET